MDNKEYRKKYYIKHKKEFREYAERWRKANPEKVKEIKKRCYIKNIKKNRRKARERRNNNLEEVRMQSNQWKKDNPVKVKEYNKIYHDNNLERAIEWRKNNSERTKEIGKLWYKKNYDRRLAVANRYRKKRIKIDLKYKLSCRMTGAIGRALKGNKKGRHWEDLVGYTLNDLMKRLKRTMPEGYTWQDYLEGKLHIDHKIPISVFNFTHPEHTDFKRCWALENLRLLPAKENLVKYNKLTRPFQPALKI